MYSYGVLLWEIVHCRPQPQPPPLCAVSASRHSLWHTETRFLSLDGGVCMGCLSELCVELPFRIPFSNRNLDQEQLAHQIVTKALCMAPGIPH